MIIGIDARMVAGVSGIPRYIEQVTTHMAAQKTPHTFVLFVLPETKKQIEEGVYLETLQSWQIIAVDIAWYSWQEQVILPRIFSKYHIDIMFFPHWNVPLWYNKPYIVMIHDLIMYHFPKREATTLGPLMYAIKDAVHRQVVAHAAKHAQTIMVPTQFTKQDVCSTLKIDPNKVVVNYEAPLPMVAPPVDTLQPCIDTPYVLYVGNAYPHKNLSRLLAAWKIVEQQHSRLSLVLIGQESHWYDNLTQSEDYAALERIYTYHGVDDTQLANMYACARAFIFPSLYEGFGLPPLEAMQHGVPVIASSASCLPEVLGEAAIYIDPYNPEHIAHTILQVVQDTDIQSMLLHNAAKQLAQFSWEKHVQRFFLLLP